MRILALFLALVAPTAAVAHDDPPGQNPVPVPAPNPNPPKVGEASTFAVASARSDRVIRGGSLAVKTVADSGDALVQEIKGNVRVAVLGAQAFSFELPIEKVFWTREFWEKVRLEKSYTAPAFRLDLLSTEGDCDRVRLSGFPQQVKVGETTIEALTAVMCESAPGVGIKTFDVEAASGSRKVRVGFDFRSTSGGTPVALPATPKPSKGVDLESLKAHVGILASQEFAGRGSGQPGNTKARDYVAAWFAAVKLAPKGENGTAFQAFRVSAGTGRTENVLGAIEVSPDAPWIVIGAHMDHLGQRGSSIYFGADDNASGTATMLEIADELSAGRAKLAANILFVAWSGEELGLIGSYHFTGRPTVPLANIRFVINLDMVGYQRGAQQQWLGLGKYPDLTRELGAWVSKTFPGTGLKATAQSGGGSDHVPFARKGIAHAFAFTDFHACYHKTCDTAEKINYAGMVNIGKTAAQLARIVGGKPQTVSSVDPETIAADPSLSLEKGQTLE